MKSFLKLIATAQEHGEERVIIYGGSCSILEDIFFCQGMIDA